MRGQRRGFSALHFLVRGNQGLDWVAEKGNLHGVCLVGCLLGRAHIFRRPFSTGRNCSRNSLVMALSCCSPFAIIVPEESSKETRFSRQCAIYFPTSQTQNCLIFPFFFLPWPICLLLDQVINRIVKLGCFLNHFKRLWLPIHLPR